MAITQFYIMEIKQLSDDSYEDYKHFVWDEDPDKARLKAESKYHEILSVAATSNTKKHGAIILSDECFPVMNYCYKHPNVQAPDPAPEPTPEPEDEEGENG